MGTSGVDHGYENHSCGNLTANTITVGSLTGAGIGIGSFTVTAAGVTTITDANIPSGAKVSFTAANALAGLLIATKSCYIGTGTAVAGSFTFVVSATGVGAPAGTESFNYFYINET